MARGWRLAAMATAIVAGGLVSSLAEAKEFYVEDSNPTAQKCYVKAFVPAKVHVNTEGQLVRPQTQQWVVSTVGTVEKWTLVTEPAVYVETREVVEAAHYTLRPVDCAAYMAPPKPALSCYKTGGDRIICAPN
ncbi:hypothetical protein AB7M35_003259 [Amorphus suaedae]